MSDSAKYPHSELKQQIFIRLYGLESISFHHPLIYNLMAVQEYSNPHGSGEQVTFPNQYPQQIQQAPPSLIRDNPSLLRVHADDQDKKTTCMFWSVLLLVIILLAIVAKFAVPSVYIKNNLKKSLAGTQLAACDNPSGVVGDQLACQANSLYYGEVVVGWGPINQFGLLYLEVRPADLSKPIKISQKYILQMYNLRLRGGNFQIISNPSSINTSIDFSSDKAYRLYADDGNTVVGYQYLLAFIIQFDENPFAEQVQFSQSLNLNLTTVRLQSYAVNQKFTKYTIILRYVFFAIAILTGTLYFVRYVKIPQDKKIIQQKMIAVASVLTIMFNDPFYPITVLKPNGASVFFSLLFIINLITFLFLMWLVFADRIYFQDGQRETVQLTLKKIAYVAILWLILIICMMAYAMQQVSGEPFVPDDFAARYVAARVIIGLYLFVGMVYICVRFIRSCMSPEGRTWRSSLFMAFSSAFIFGVFIIVVTNSLILYNYSGSGIMVVYGLINIYVYYLQYMFTITREEVQKLQNPEADQQFQQNNYDVITVGTIDLVDVNLDDDMEDFSDSNEKNRKKKKLDEDENKKEHKHEFQASEFD